MSDYYIQIQNKKNQLKNSSNQKGQNSIYDWIEAAGALIIMACSLGAINNCFALFTIPVTESLHISRTVFSTGQTGLFIGTMAVNAVVGKMIDRFHIIKLLRITAILLPLLYVSFSFAKSGWQFILTSLLCGCVLPCISTVPLSLYIQRLFSKNTGLALGVVMMGSGIGGMIFNPLGNYFIEKYGWRNAYRLNGLIMLICLFFSAFAILRELPETKASGPARNKGENERSSIFSGWFLLELFLCACMGAATYTSINFTSTYFQDIGGSSSFAARIASYTMAAMAVGKIAVGRLYDRMGVQKATLLCIICLLIGMIGFSMGSSSPAAVGAILLGAGIGCPVGTVAPMIIMRCLFGNENLSRRLGIGIACGNLGAAATPMIAGMVYKNFGSYQMMYVCVGGICLLAFLLYLVFFIKKPQL